MIRAAIAAATGLVVCSAAGVGTAGALHDASTAVGRIVAPGVSGITVGDAPDHTATVHAPAGTALLAVAEGRLTVLTPGHVLITGAGDDAGLVVDAANLGDNVPDGTVRRGDTVGQVLDPTHDVTVRAVLDGEPLDTPALLRAALNGAGRGGWSRPLAGAVVTQPFGCTPYSMEPVDRNCPSGHFHSGIDLAAPMGTPIRAALDGLAHVAVSATGFGLHVVVDSGDGLTTLYGHMSSVAVHEGDEVSAGDVIGAVGSTGNSTGPHLHFEVRRDGIPEDPTLDVALP
jgi:Peptidase family M23